MQFLNIGFLLFLSTFFGNLLISNAATRQPTARDHLLCKIKYEVEWNQIMEEQDPYSVVEAYYDQHGDLCKTPCRIRSQVNSALTAELGVLDSPDYENCGASHKFCMKGECITKRFIVA